MDKVIANFNSTGQQTPCVCKDGCAIRITPGCQEYVPAVDYEALESQVATLTLQCATQAEAIRSLLTVIDRGCSPKTCGYQLFGDLCDLDDTECIALGVVEFAKVALSLTPSSVRQQAEDARIGRAVRDLAHNLLPHEHPRHEIKEWQRVQSVLRDLIAEARES